MIPINLLLADPDLMLDVEAYEGQRMAHEDTTSRVMKVVWFLQRDKEARSVREHLAASTSASSLGDQPKEKTKKAEGGDATTTSASCVASCSLGEGKGKQTAKQAEGGGATTRQPLLGSNGRRGRCKGRGKGA